MFVSTCEIGENSPKSIFQKLRNKYKNRKNYVCEVKISYLYLAKISFHVMMSSYDVEVCWNSLSTASHTL